MDRGTWQATVHGTAELDTTERLTLPFFHIYICMYLPAPSLSCSMQDLQSSLHIRDLLVTACGIYLPNQELNPCPLHWELGVLATR